MSTVIQLANVNRNKYNVSSIEIKRMTLLESLMDEYHVSIEALTEAVSGVSSPNILKIIRLTLARVNKIKEQIMSIATEDEKLGMNIIDQAVLEEEQDIELVGLEEMQGIELVDLEVGDNDKPTT